MALKRLLAASLLAALAIALWPAPAQAQRRGGRVVRPPAVIVTAYPRFYYDPWRPYPFDWYGPYPYGQRYYNDTASLRIQVTPSTAEVFIDGYYAGIVDQFDGTFQRLRIEPGAHEIVVFAEGYRTFEQKLYIQPLSTITVKETLERLQAGEVQSARPSPPPPSATAAPPAQGPRAPRRPTPRPPTRTEPPARQEPPPAPQATRQDAPFGVLSIRVQPGGSDVVIDGERWEGTGGDERLLVQLAPGSHQVEVRRAGYQTFTRTLDIRRGETETLNVSLSRQ